MLIPITLILFAALAVASAWLFMMNQHKKLRNTLFICAMVVFLLFLGITIARPFVSKAYASGIEVHKTEEDIYEEVSVGEKYVRVIIKGDNGLYQTRNLPLKNTSFIFEKDNHKLKIYESKFTSPWRKLWDIKPDNSYVIVLPEKARDLFSSTIG